VEFTADGLRRIAEIAWQVNERTENIGARRLHTVMERLMEDVAYEAPDKAGTSLSIGAAYVDEKLKKLAGDEDLSRYIL
jgi:ATP-dependent HslUV protease ATP-binding subunit HslU